MAPHRACERLLARVLSGRGRQLLSVVRAATRMADGSCRPRWRPVSPRSCWCRCCGGTTVRLAEYGLARESGRFARSAPTWSASRHVSREAAAWQGLLPHDFEERALFPGFTILALALLACSPTAALDPSGWKRNRPIRRRSRTGVVATTAGRLCCGDGSRAGACPGRTVGVAHRSDSAASVRPAPGVHGGIRALASSAVLLRAAAFGLRGGGAISSIFLRRRLVVLWLPGARSAAGVVDALARDYVRPVLAVMQIAGRGRHSRAIARSWLAGSAVPGDACWIRGGRAAARIPCAVQRWRSSRCSRC